MNAEGLSVTSVSPGVEMVTAPNPGPKTLSGTNTYIVGETRRIIIDPGPDLPEHLEALAGYLYTAREIAAIWLTHSHPDHAAGATRLAELLGVTIASAGAPEPNHLHHGLHEVLGSFEIHVLASPGHSADHLCFLVDPGKVLISGDVILGTGSTLVALPEGDMVAYMATLRRLQELGARMIAPGHGPIVNDPRTKFDEYVAHRREREGEIIAALRGAHSLSTSDIVAMVYGEQTPEIHRLAELSVGAQLAKLLDEGKVSVSAGGGQYSLLED